LEKGACTSPLFVCRWVNPARECVIAVVLRGAASRRPLPFSRSTITMRFDLLGARLPWCVGAQHRALSLSFHAVRIEVRLHGEVHVISLLYCYRKR
jgi:hypothetical protein